MSYIGKEPSVGNFVKLDAISVVNGQASYTMQSSSVNFTPESANHMLVSLNGVIQAPIDSFTVSGSTITFASGLSTGDVIDFIMVYGNVLDIGVPSDNTVSASKLTTDSVQTAKIVDDAVTKAKVNFISDATAGVEVKGDGGSNDGYIQLNCSQNSHGIKLKSPPHSASASYTLTFPNNDGNANEFLQTDGSGVLSWGAVSSDFVKLASGSFSSNSLSFDGYFSSTYSHYKIILTDVIPSTNNPNISMRYRISDADVTTSDYQNVGQHGAIQIGTASSDGTSNQTNTDQFKLQQGYSVSNASNLCMNAELTIFNPLNTSLYKHYHYKSSQHYSSATGYWVTSTGGGYYDANTTALSGFTIFASTGNITSGNCYLYGVKA
jgi:hypothetical protein